MPTIATFDLVISEESGSYTAQVRAAYGVGELPKQPFELPLELADLPEHRQEVADWIEQARVIRRSSRSEELRQAEELGRTLFEHLFTGELLACFRESRKALPLNQFLRVRLHLPASLVALPWELLYDPREEQFLALSPDLILVRYPEIPSPILALELDGPLQVVFVAASPKDLPPLEIGQELQRITEALEGPISRNQIAFSVIQGPDTLGQLRVRLREAAHVVHFLGHGEVDRELGEGVLMFEDADGSASPVNANLLRVQLQKQRGQTQLVVLNACLGAVPASGDPFSSVGADLLRAGVPAVIAMQFAISDEVAIDLARVFYTELAAGTPVDLAVNETRMHLFGRNPFRLDWIIPVLYLRAPDGALFTLASDAKGASPTPSPPADPSPQPVVDISIPRETGAEALPRASKRRQRRPLPATLAILAVIILLALFVRSVFPEEVPATSSPTVPFSTQAPEAIRLDMTAAAEPAALPEPRFQIPVPTLPPLTATNISNTPGRSEHVQIAVDAGGAVHVVWLDNTPRQGRAETVLYRSINQDGTWSGIEDLTPELEYIGLPHLVVSLTRKVCLVLDSVAGIFSRCLEEDGWSPLANPIISGTRNVFAPALGDDGTLRWLVGLNDVRFDGAKLDDGLAGILGAQFAIDARGGYHAVWTRFGNPYSIEHRYSNDAGGTWQPQERLSAPDAKFAESPSLAAGTDGAVHLVWAEWGKLLYRKWTAASGWERTVSMDTGAVRISLAVDTLGGATAVWVGGCEVRYARLLPNETWSQERVLNANASPSQCATEAEIAIDDRGWQHIVWESPGNDGERDVYYASLPADR